MPDGDIIPRRVPRSWRGVARLARGYGAPAELGPRIARALTATLRETGGVPGLNDLGEALKRCATNLSDWAVESARILRESEGHPHTQLAIYAGGVLLEAEREGVLSWDRSEVTQCLAEAVLRRLVGRNLFGRIRPLLVAGRFPSVKATREFEAQCVEATSIKAIAQRLVARESGKGIVAPPAPRPEGTEALLHRPLAG